MIIAPDVFEISDGTYTPTVATAWVTQHGTPSPLYIGRTLRHTTAGGWEVGPATQGAKPIWKSVDKASKAIKRAFDAARVVDDPREGYYELIGPGLAANPHQLDEGTFHLVNHGQGVFDAPPPRTSLYALQNWIAERNDLQGILWVWRDPESRQTRYAAVRRSLLLR